MNFLLDENFPKSAADFLKEAGHSAWRVLELAEQGTRDHAVFELAQQERAILLTTDRDFFHTIPWLFAEHHGVIVIALKQPNRAAILLKLEWILGKLPPQNFRDRVFQLRDTSWIAIPPLS